MGQVYVLCNFQEIIYSHWWGKHAKSLPCFNIFCSSDRELFPFAFPSRRSLSCSILFKSLISSGCLGCSFNVGYAKVTWCKSRRQLVALHWYASWAWSPLAAQWAMGWHNHQSPWGGAHTWCAMILPVQCSVIIHAYNTIQYVIGWTGLCPWRSWWKRWW